MRLLLKEPKGILNALLCLWVIFLHSCHPNNNYQAKHYSETLFDSALRMGNAGLKNSAVCYVDSAYARFSFISTADKFRYYSFMHDMYRSYYSPLKNIQQALKYTDSMMLLLQETDNTETMAREYALVYLRKADIFREQRNYTEAFRYFSQARLIAEKLQDTCLRVKYDAALGEVLFRQHKYLKAAALYRQALSETNSCSETVETYGAVQWLLNDLGFFYDQAGIPDSALACYKQAETYIESKRVFYVADPNFPDIALSLIYENEAMLMLEEKDYQKAETLFKKSDKLMIAKGGPKASPGIVELQLARVYFKLNKPAPALQLINEVQKALPHYDLDTRISWFEAKWLYDSTFGTALQAASSHAAYLNLKDSIDDNNVTAREANMNDAFANLESQYKIDLLQKEDKEKTLYLAVSIILGLMAIVIISLVWRDRRRTKVLASNLAMYNQQILTRNDHLYKTLNALEKSQEVNTRMLKIVVHDLRGPVGAILSFTEVMQNDEMKANDRKQALQLMEKTARSALTLIGDLLHINVAPKEMVRVPVDLTSLLQYCIDIMEPKAVAKKQQLIFTPVKVTVIGDNEKLWRVFSNLIANAIKFSPEKGIITVAMRTEQTEVIIMVEDNGIGIPAHMRDNLFDASTETKRKGTADEPSFGLGLAICKEIVEVHGGRVWLGYKTGQGSVFFVSLPIMP